MSDETTSTESNAETAAPAPEGTVTTEKPTPQLSPAGQNALRALMDRERAVRTQETQMKSQAEEFQRQQDAFRRSQEPEEQDPNQVLGGELEKLRAELDSFKQREQTYRQQTLVSEEKARVRAALSGGEEFKAIEATDAYDTVFETMLSHYNTTGEWMSETEAAKQVNSSLLDLAKKLAPLMGAQAPTAQSPDTHATQEEAYNTLNSRMTSEAGSQPSDQPMSRTQINKAAAAFLRFKTK